MRFLFSPILVFLFCSLGHAQSGECGFDYLEIWDDPAF